MAMRTKGLKTIETLGWEQKIISTISQNFSNKSFCVYDIANEIMSRKEAENKNDFFKWLQRTRKVIKTLEATGKIQFVGYAEGRGPILKKMYKVVAW
jgi:hypothetical protein